MLSVNQEFKLEALKKTQMDGTLSPGKKFWILSNRYICVPALTLKVAPSTSYVLQLL